MRVTVKQKLQLLVEGLSEEEAERVLPLVEARVQRREDGRVAAVRALDRLHELIADLPGFDALRAAGEARLELDERPSP